MTTAAVPADLVPLRPAWRSLLWFAPLTVLWTLMIYSWPAIPASGVPTTTHQLAAHGLIALGLWLGLEHTSLTPTQRRATWLAIMIPDTLWFAVAWSAAINGVFHPGTTPLPVLPSAIFMPVIIGVPLLLFSQRIGQVLDEMPASWLVALQVYRVFGSWALAAWLRGALPGVFALPAGIGDVLTGLFALPAAIVVATGTAEGRRAAALWNIFGLRCRDHHGHDHLARPVAVDRSGCAEHRRWRLSGCADPCFRGPKLNPAARAVATPTAPPSSDGGSAAIEGGLGTCEWRL